MSYILTQKDFDDYVTMALERESGKVTDVDGSIAPHVGGELTIVTHSQINRPLRFSLTENGYEWYSEEFHEKQRCSTHHAELLTRREEDGKLRINIDLWDAIDADRPRELVHIRAPENITYEELAALAQLPLENVIHDAAQNRNEVVLAELHMDGTQAEQEKALENFNQKYPLFLIYESDDLQVPHALAVAPTFEPNADYEQALKEAGVTTIDDIDGLEPGLYLDTKANRKLCHEVLEKEPQYRIKNCADEEDIRYWQGIYRDWSPEYTTHYKSVEEYRGTEQEYSLCFAVKFSVKDELAQKMLDPNVDNADNRLGDIYGWDCCYDEQYGSYVCNGWVEVTFKTPMPIPDKWNDGYTNHYMGSDDLSKSNMPEWLADKITWLSKYGFDKGEADIKEIYFDNLMLVEPEIVKPEQADMNNHNEKTSELQKAATLDPSQFKAYRELFQKQLESYQRLLLDYGMTREKVNASIMEDLRFVNEKTKENMKGR